MDLKALLTDFEKWAPVNLAEKWDNVGLLIQPSGSKMVKNVLLTNDLTEAVMSEALDTQTDLIFSYHPPIFAPLKRITGKAWKERIVQQCLENRIALYSPHTAFDALEGGVADWLLQPIGSGPITVLHQGQNPSFSGNYSHSVKVDQLPPLKDDVNTALATIMNIQGVKVHVEDSQGSVTVDCGENALPEVIAALEKPAGMSSSMIKVFRLEKHSILGQGMGRLKTLDKALTLREIVQVVKKHTGVEHLRVCVAMGKDLDCAISSVASCAGAGTSVLKGCSADLWLTGEMSHHDLLDVIHNGGSVILCEHSNSERNFLRDVVAGKIKDICGSLEVKISQKDRDPVMIV